MQVRTLRDFFRLESSSGLLLFFCAVLAIIIDNTPFHAWYDQLVQYEEGFHFSLVNDGFMSLFFFLVGLEIKREIIAGELNSFSKAFLPAIAALGGMLMPAFIYFLCNAHNPTTLKGWGIPCATDIAFSLAILNLLSRSVPWGLRIFLMALAIFDDLGAILIIAFFYSATILPLMLIFSALLFLLLLSFNFMGVVRVWPYLVVGFILWFLVLQSGVHATIAGVLVALTIPTEKIQLLEKRLHPWVAFGILPIFAFMNAGMSFSGVHLSHLFNSLSLGIIAGLFLGKQLGIVGASWMAIRLGIGRLPHGATWLGLYAISLVAGVGFTMSLFIGNLAFPAINPDYKLFVRIGVITGSMLSGITGYLMMKFFHKTRSVN